LSVAGRRPTVRAAQKRPDHHQPGTAYHRPHVVHRQLRRLGVSVLIVVVIIVASLSIRLSASSVSSVSTAEVLPLAPGLGSGLRRPRVFWVGLGLEVLDTLFRRATASAPGAITPPSPRPAVAVFLLR